MVAWWIVVSHPVTRCTGEFAARWAVVADGAPLTEIDTWQGYSVALSATKVHAAVTAWHT
ncbi:MAG: hypothetical protein EBX18_03700 [Actinobacteria bacterium]|jgi:hypothetical protein|nr:hypothetical protein [Actinomycetota bacterium]